jgi:hypothetical protein
MRPWLLGSAVFGLLVGCTPADRSGSVSAHLYARDEAGAYGFQVAQLENLHSLNGLEGRDVRLKRGAEISMG